MLQLLYKISAAEADISNMQSKLIPPKREKMCLLKRLTDS